jgi:hypothetical protein
VKYNTFHQKTAHSTRMWRQRHGTTREYKHRRKIRDCCGDGAQLLLAHGWSLSVLLSFGSPNLSVFVRLCLRHRLRLCLCVYVPSCVSSFLFMLVRTCVCPSVFVCVCLSLSVSASLFVLLRVCMYLMVSVFVCQCLKCARTMRRCM